MNDTILIIGSNGQVGRELIHFAQRLGNVIATKRNDYKYPVDLEDLDSVRQIIRKIKPDIIINAAAYTAVDQAENDEMLALQINCTAPKTIAEEAKKIDSLLVHYSTDYVFDGKKEQAYTEDDKVNPINVYGTTKLAGENAIINSGCRYLIFRTSWVYSPYGNNFVKSIVSLANERDQLTIVNDQIGCPNSAYFIANTTVEVLLQYSQFEIKNLHGVYNLSTSETMSWYDFSQHIVRIGSELDRCKTVNIAPISSNEYKTLAERPKFSVLSNEKLYKNFNINEKPWMFYLEKCIDAI